MLCKPISCDQADHLSSSRRASSSLRRSATSEATAGSVVSAIGVPSCFFIFLPSELTGKSSGLSACRTRASPVPFSATPSEPWQRHSQLCQLPREDRLSKSRALSSSISPVLRLRYRSCYGQASFFLSGLASVPQKASPSIYSELTVIPKSLYGNNARLAPFHFNGIVSSGKIVIQAKSCEALRPLDQFCISRVEV